MIKPIAFGLAAAVLIGAPPASAQVFQLGPDGPSIDFRPQHERERDYRRERARERALRRHDRDLSTGSLDRNCRSITVRERNDAGRMVTRRIRECED